MPFPANSLFSHCWQLGRWVGDSGEGLIWLTRGGWLGRQDFHLTSTTTEVDEDLLATTLSFLRSTACQPPYDQQAG